jgi:ABC-2 type transport system permease protein
MSRADPATALPTTQADSLTALPATQQRGRGLRAHIANIYRLVIKELRSIRADPAMLVLVAYSFSLAVYTVSTGASTEATNLSIGIVDEDGSPLSRQISEAFVPPTFQHAVQIAAPQIDKEMDAGRLLFVVEIPPSFQTDVLAGRQEAVQVNVDATAITQAGNGANYIKNVITNEVQNFISGREGSQRQPINLVIRAEFNPNLLSSWFTSVMQVINSITLLTVILTGAALIREREQGTVEHLLVMPVVPTEIMLAKILANGLVILVAAMLSLTIVVQWWLQVPIAGSRLLFFGGTCLYCLVVAALGILLGTLSTSMGQFGLLAIPVLLVMQLLSGSTTPMESMPVWLQYVMQVISPTPHFVAFAQAVLFRGAGLSIVWRELVAMVVIGSVYFAFALRRFRRVIFGS